MKITEIQNIPTDVQILNDAYAIVSFTIPTDAIRPFMFMFQSLSGLMQNVAWKVKTNESLIHSRNEKQKSAIEERQVDYEKAVIETYKNYINQGNTPRESLSMTTSALNNHYSFSSYDNVKKMLTKNKLLKNTGFYGSRHKFE